MRAPGSKTSAEKKKRRGGDPQHSQSPLLGPSTYHLKNRNWLTQTHWICNRTHTSTSQHPGCLWGNILHSPTAVRTKIIILSFVLISSPLTFPHSIASCFHESHHDSAGFPLIKRDVNAWLFSVRVTVTVSIGSVVELEIWKEENYPPPGRPNVLRSRWVIAFMSGWSGSSRLECWQIGPRCGIGWFYALFTCIWLQYQTANREHLGLFILLIQSSGCWWSTSQL